jgi:hypothetical protein
MDTTGAQHGPKANEDTPRLFEWMCLDLSSNGRLPTTSHNRGQGVLPTFGATTATAATNTHHNRTMSEPCRRARGEEASSSSSSSSSSSELLSGPNRHGFRNGDMLRLMVNSLRDMGFHEAADHVERDSRITSPPPEFDTLRRAVLSGEWQEVFVFAVLLCCFGRRFWGICFFV